MSDLRGFTAIIAEMDPEKVITFLNRYLSKMIEILLDHRAVIDEILGDGILAFFGAPEPLEDHPARAVACALAMQAAMDEINAANEAEGLPRLAMGIGVNTGPVVVGNIGSERRTKYSVVGSDVNFASRMEAYALAGQVLISASTYSRVRDLVEVGQAKQVEMKGVPGPATLYEVRAIGAPYNIRLGDKSEELGSCRNRVRVQVHRLKDKIVTDDTGEAWVTHLGETVAGVRSAGKVAAWEDVRLTLLDETRSPPRPYLWQGHQRQAPGGRPLSRPSSALLRCRRGSARPSPPAGTSPRAGVKRAFLICPRIRRPGGLRPVSAGGLALPIVLPLVAIAQSFSGHLPFAFAFPRCEAVQGEIQMAMGLEFFSPSRSRPLPATCRTPILKTAAVMLYRGRPRNRDWQWILGKAPPNPRAVKAVFAFSIGEP